MVFRQLKVIRVIISVAFFLLITFLFIDFSATLSTSWKSGLLYFQYLPSVFKFINLLSWMATGFIVVSLLSLLMGRVYCSFLCPLGTLQDILIYFREKFGKRIRRKYYRPLNWIRFPILIFSIILLLFFGNVLLLEMLDPYSNFGRIMSNFLRPVYYSMTNFISYLLELQDNYSLKPVELKNIGWISLGYSLVILALIIWMSLKHGRLYCNTACPVGTLLGQFAEVSLFKIRLEESLCNSCGICSSNCKANCIDAKNKHVDFSRCVGCLNCLYVCPGGGVKFMYNLGLRKKVAQDPAGSEERRAFVKKSALLTAGAAVLSKTVLAQEVKKALVPINREHPVTPPGSGDVMRFNSYCTACTLCVSACPTQVLQPSFLEYGLAGMMQPRMDYKTSFCNFECVICTEVCPTGAIKPISIEEKKLLQLGKSYFVKENCVVYTDGTACGACSEHCPTKAVNMVPYDEKPGLTIPEVTNDYCVGCGACEYACPTDPKSIYVEGNVTHLQAKKPKEEEIEKQELEEFPF